MLDNFFYHLVYNGFYLRNVLCHCQQNNLGINFKIVMRYLISHTHYPAPLNLRI